jgi:hypothetical protein
MKARLVSGTITSGSGRQAEAYLGSSCPRAGRVSCWYGRGVRA